MTRFFFDVHDDLVAQDEEGLELADAEEAKAKALTGARALAAEQVSKGYLHLGHRIKVRDEAGQPVAEITFKEAVAIEA